MLSVSGEELAVAEVLALFLIEDCVISVPALTPCHGRVPRRKYIGKRLQIIAPLADAY
jgi:hypothetical protein